MDVWLPPIFRVKAIILGNEKPPLRDVDGVNPPKTNSLDLDSTGQTRNELKPPHPQRVIRLRIKNGAYDV